MKTRYISTSAHIWTFVLVVLFPAVINPRPSGAPRSACVSMTPGHGGTSAQTSASPYSLQLDRGVTSYGPGEMVKGRTHTAYLF